MCYTVMRKFVFYSIRQGHELPSSKPKRHIRGKRRQRYNHRGYVKFTFLSLSLRCIISLINRFACSLPNSNKRLKFEEPVRTGQKYSTRKCIRFDRRRHVLSRSHINHFPFQIFTAPPTRLTDFRVGA